MIQNLIDKSMSKSPWVFHVNAGSCNGCDIEIVSVLTPRYDAERLGFRLTGTPRQADIVVVSGPITLQTRDRLVRTLKQVPEPFCVVSIGSCPPFRQRVQGQLRHRRSSGKVCPRGCVRGRLRTEARGHYGRSGSGCRNSG